MPKMTLKMQRELYDLQCAAALLPAYLYPFTCRSIRGIYKTAEDFDSRKELQEHIDTLTDLINTTVNSQ